MQYDRSRYLKVQVCPMQKINGTISELKIAYFGVKNYENNDRGLLSAQRNHSSPGGGDRFKYLLIIFNKMVPTTAMSDTRH